MWASESETAETSNDFLSNIVKKLHIPKFNSNNSVIENIKNPVFKAILKDKNHPSILAIRKYSKNKTFHFEKVNIGEVGKEILKLDKNKTSQKINIPTRIIKENIDVFAEFLCTSTNSAIKPLSFLSSLKLADGYEIWKDMKENFRPISILPILSKYFEKCMFSQMSTFFDNIFSNQQCGIRKGYSTQHCPLVIWKHGRGL